MLFDCNLDTITVPFPFQLGDLWVRRRNRSIWSPINHDDAIFLAQNPFERSRYPLIDRSLAHLEAMTAKNKPKAKAATHKSDTVDLDNIMVTPEERAAARRLLEQSSDPIVAKNNNMAQMAHRAKANGIEYACSSRGDTRANYSDKYSASA